MSDDRAIREWGLANGYACKAGRLSQQLRADYATFTGDFTSLEVAPEAPEPEGAVFRLVCDLPGAEDVNEEVSAQLLEAVWTIFHAGRAAERRDLLARLGADQ